MTTQHIQQWLVDWFVGHGQIAADQIQQRLAENYLSSGWIDSFAFIALINDVEQQFHIKFSNDEFQDRSFATIEGLAHAISQKING